MQTMGSFTRLQSISALLPCLATSIIFASASPVLSQTATTDVQTRVVYEGSRIRINLSGQMRHITEELAAASCSLEVDFDRGTSIARLAASRANFDNVFAALSHGNPRLGVPSRERNSNVKSALTQLLKIWASSSVNTMKMLQEPDTSSYSEVVASNTPEQARISQIVADEYIAHYVNPAEIFAADALTVSLAGRQLKLIREMEKLTCSVLSGNASYGDAAEFDEVAKLFQRTLSALSTGLENAGVIAPPNRAIQDKISEIEGIWDHYATSYQQLSQSAQDVEGTWITLRDEVDELFASSQQLVSLYLLAAQGNNQAYKVAVSSYAEEELGQWIQDEELRADGTAAGFLDIRQTQSKGLVLAAATFDIDASRLASTPLAPSLFDGVDLANLEGQLSVSDAVLDTQTGIYYCQVVVPMPTNDGTSRFLVVNVNLLMFL